MRSRPLRRGWLLVAFGLLAASCAQASETPTVSVAPTAIPGTAEAGWTTYSDEVARFSISYPDDWEIFTLDEAATKEFFDNVMQTLDVTVAPVIVLSVGLPRSAGGFEPNITVIVEQISAQMDLEAYVAGSVQSIEVAFPSYTSTEQVDAVVRGRDSVFVHGSYALADVLPDVDGRWSVIQLLAVDGFAGWSVSCGTTKSAASALAADLELCESALRTFELSSP